MNSRDEALKKLGSLDLNPEVKTATETFLQEVLTPHSPIPSIAEGDTPGTALLYWKTGDTSLEVEISPGSNHIYLWARTAEGNKTTTCDKNQAVTLAASIVATMTATLAATNPHWKKKYKQWQPIS